ncbi:MAG: hypothetical protein Q9180_009456, partial [Flavoplaca navasiana]
HLIIPQLKSQRDYHPLFSTTVSTPKHQTAQSFSREATPQHNTMEAISSYPASSVVQGQISKDQQLMLQRVFRMIIVQSQKIMASQSLQPHSGVAYAAVSVKQLAIAMDKYLRLGDTADRTTHFMQERRNSNATIPEAVANQTSVSNPRCSVGPGVVKTEQNHSRGISTVPAHRQNEITQSGSIQSGGSGLGIQNIHGSGTPQGSSRAEAPPAAGIRGGRFGSVLIQTASSPAGAFQPRRLRSGGFLGEGSSSGGSPSGGSSSGTFQPTRTQSQGSQNGTLRGDRGATPVVLQEIEDSDNGRMDIVTNNDEDWDAEW